MQTRTLLSFKDLGAKKFRFNLQNDKLEKKIQKFYSCTETRLSAVLANELFDKDTSSDNNTFITKMSSKLVFVNLKNKFL